MECMLVFFRPFFFSANFLRKASPLDSDQLALCGTMEKRRQLKYCSKTMRKEQNRKLTQLVPCEYPITEVITCSLIFRGNKNKSLNYETDHSIHLPESLAYCHKLLSSAFLSIQH